MKITTNHGEEIALPAPREMSPGAIAAYLSTVDPTLEIEDDSDRRLFDSILSRPREEVNHSHCAFIYSLIERGGRKFQRPA